MVIRGNLEYISTLKNAFGAYVTHFITNSSTINLRKFLLDDLL